MNGHKRKVNCILNVEQNVWTGADDGSVVVWKKDNFDVKFVPPKYPLLKF